MEAAIRDRVASWIAEQRDDESSSSSTIADSNSNQKHFTGDAAKNGVSLQKPSSSLLPPSEPEPTNMTCLLLDGRAIRDVTTRDAELLKKFTKLVKLTCNQTSLQKLSSFPPLPSLKSLELTDNLLAGDQLVFIPKLFPNLRVLEVGGNHIKSLDDIVCLRHLPNLERLGLDLNPIAEKPNYRESVLNALPQISILDCCDRQGVEVDERSDDDEDDDEYADEEDEITLKEFCERDFNEVDDPDDVDFDPDGLHDANDDDVIDDCGEEEEEDDDDVGADDNEELAGDTDTRMENGLTRAVDGDVEVDGDESSNKRSSKGSSSDGPPLKSSRME